MTPIEKTVIISNQMTQPYSSFITEVLKEISKTNQDKILIVTASDDNPVGISLYAYNINEEDLRNSELAIRKYAVSQYASQLVDLILEEERREMEEDTQNLIEEIPPYDTDEFEDYEEEEGEEYLW